MWEKYILLCICVRGVHQVELLAGGTNSRGEEEEELIN